MNKRFLLDKKPPLINVMTYCYYLLIVTGLPNVCPLSLLILILGRRMSGYFPTNKLLPPVNRTCYLSMAMSPSTHIPKFVKG